MKMACSRIGRDQNGMENVWSSVHLLLYGIYYNYWKFYDKELALPSIKSSTWTKNIKYCEKYELYSIRS